MKANYGTWSAGLRFWWEDGIHHNNCKQCRFSSGCTDKNKRHSDKCSKFRPNSFKRKKRCKK